MKIFLGMVAVILAAATAYAAGYNIVTVNQVTPQYITVHGASGEEIRLNPGHPVSNPSGRFICQSAGFSQYSTLQNHRQRVYENGTATDAEVLAACPTLKDSIAAQILDVRKQALAKLSTDNAGLMAVYDENRDAANAVMKNAGGTLTRGGNTATALMARFGANLNMTAMEYAAWVVDQNQQVGSRMEDIDNEYMRITYTVIPASTSVSELLMLPAQFRAFCGL